MQPQGTPCWIDLTTDMDRATAFYGAVLGWAFASLGPDAEGRVLAEADGRPVAGLGPGEPSYWQVYLRSDDADAVCLKAGEHGATVELLAGDVGVLGRAAKLRDPSGAPFALWQAGSHDGFEMDGREGSPGWFEVATRDSVTVRDFFAGLFELGHQKMDGMDYYMLVSEGQPRYGVLQMDEAWAGLDPHWMVYFCVDDIEAAAARVRAAGGEVAYGPFDTPYGRIAVCKDPMGMPFSLTKPSAPEAS